MSVTNCKLAPLRRSVNCVAVLGRLTAARRRRQPSRVSGVDAALTRSYASLRFGTFVTVP